MIRRNAARLLFLALLALAMVPAAAWAQSVPNPLAATGASGETADEDGEQGQPGEGAEQVPQEPVPGTSLDSMVDPGEAGNRNEDWRRQLQHIASRLQNQRIGTDELQALRERVLAIASSARDLEARLEPQLQAVRARLQQLGPQPAEGEPPEPEELRQRREAEQGELSRTDTALKNTRLVAVRAEQLANDISATRRDRMTERLTEVGPSAFSPELWAAVLRDAAAGVEQLLELIGETWEEAGEAWGPIPLMLLGIAVSATVVGRILIRSLAQRYNVQDREGEEQSISRKLLRAAIITLSIGILPNVLLFALFVILDAYGVADGPFSEVLRGVFTAVGISVFVFSLARAFLAPQTPRWRLVTLSDGAASRLSAYVSAVGMVLGASVFMQVTNNALVSAVSLDIARRAITAFLIAILFSLALRRLAVEWSERLEAETAEDPSPVSVILRILLWTVIAIIFGALVLGYVSLAGFLAVQMVFAVTVISILWLAVGVTDDLITTYVTPGRSAGRALQAGFGLSSGGVKQIAVLSSGILRLALIVFALMLILVPWGFEADRWTSWLKAAFFGFDVGEVTISLSSILTALLLMALGIAATRAIQRWLGSNYLPNTRLDVGMRNSIRTMAGYVGVIAAVVFAFGYVGLDLENVALLAGALSVGIGFGLQSIVNNFVSGLILLAERPIKEGDWIVVGAEQGYVRKISIRATEIETFDRGTVIVPNSDLITGTVKNWTHSSMIGRVDVSVTVAQGAATQKVHDLMLEIAREHPSVLYYPEPAVLLWDFKDGAMSFRLWAFIGDINYVYNVASDLRFEIERRFAAEGITIPFPQRDLRITNIETMETEAGAKSARAAAAGGAG